MTRKTGLRRLLITSSLLAIAATGIWAIVNYWPTSISLAEADTPTTTVRKMTIPDIVVEQGTLESQQAIKGVCKAEGWEFKIIKILPEGTQVEKGQIVCEFDSSEVVKEITEQELEIQEAESDVQDAEQQVKVQQNENESSIRQANQEFEFAKIDLNKYQRGDFELNKFDHEAQISEAQEKVDQAKRSYDNMRALVKKGFRQFEQLREAEQVVKSAELRLKQTRQKYKILLEFEHVKSLAEFKSKREEAEFKLKAAKETAEAKLAQANDNLKYRKQRLKRRKDRLERYQKNLKKYKIPAPDSGTVAYPTERSWRAEEIREGATVYQNQTVFTLPNMRKMQAKVGIHESLISKVKPGLPATIKVDAFAGQVFKGIVTKVAPLAEQSRFSAAKTYTAIVKLNEFPADIKLKPVMTAQVEILAGRYPNSTAVPIQAIASHSGKKFAYVREGNEFVRREIEIGHSNVSFVEVKSGLDIDEEVALDAFRRSIDDFGDATPEESLAEGDSDEAFDPSTVVAPEPEEKKKGKKEKGGEDTPDKPDEAGAEKSTVGKTSDESDPDSSDDGKEIPKADDANAESSKANDSKADAADDSATKTKPAKDSESESTSEATESSEEVPKSDSSLLPDMNLDLESLAKQLEDENSQ